VLAVADIFHWDWTAIGTLALAAVTAISLRLGYLALKSTRAELEGSQRPVVVPLASNLLIENPVPPRVVMPKGAHQTEVQARPTSLEGGMLMVPVSNIGKGPALSVTVIVIGRTDTGGYSESWGNRMNDGYAYAVAVGETVPILVAVDQLGTGSTPSFDLMIAYRDLAGRNWCTEARYIRAGDDGRLGMYCKPKIQPLSGDEDPGEAMLAPQRQIEADLQAGRYEHDPPPEDEAIYE
jgi:hypothetical protein